MDVNEGGQPVKAVERIGCNCQQDFLIVIIAEEFSHGMDCSLAPTFLSCT